MRKTILILILMLALPAFAQTVIPKPSPASAELAEAAKSKVADSAVFNTQRQQAVSALDMNQKQLQAALAADQKTLQDELSKDKKYKSLLDKIDTEAKQIQGAQQTANAAFLQQTADLRNRLQLESTQIQVLVPIIRKENGWDDSYTFDLEKGVWTHKKN